MGVPVQQFVRSPLCGLLAQKKHETAEHKLQQTQDQGRAHELVTYVLCLACSLAFPSELHT